MRHDVAPCRGKTLFVFEFFVPESDRGMGQFGVIENSGLFHQVPGRNGRRAVVFGHKAASHVAGADAQLHHGRHVACLAQRKTVLNHGHHLRQIGPGVEQNHAGFQCVGMGTFLNDAGAFTVIFSDHHQHATQHARRGQVGQCICSHVGADNRLPRDRAAQGVVNRCTEHGSRRGFVGTRFDVHTQLIHVAFGLHQDIHQMGNGRTLVAADIGDARLKQGFGDGQNAFTMKDLSVAHAQGLDFLTE